MRIKELSLLGAVYMMLCSTVAQAQEAEQGSEVTEEALASKSEFQLQAFGQLFTNYGHYTSEAESFQAFELERAELGLGFLYKERHGFVVNTEAIRSAGPRSTFGIDNNSLVLRIKHAFFSSTPELPIPGELTVQAGMIPDIWVQTVEQSYDLRGIAPVGAEYVGFYQSSDLGASLSYKVLDERVWLRVAINNGEGRNQVELNNGKNTTLSASFKQPMGKLRGHPLKVGGHLSYRDGSEGVSSIASHRTSAALTVEHPALFLGGEITRARGYAQRGDLSAQQIGFWVNTTPYKQWLGLYLRAQQLTPDMSNASSHQRAFFSGLYLDIIPAQDAPRSVLGFPRLRTYLGYYYQSSDADAATITGAADTSTQHAVMLTLSARGSGIL